MLFQVLLEIPTLGYPITYTKVENENMLKKENTGKLVLIFVSD